MGTRIDENSSNTVVYYSPDLNITIRGKVISEGDKEGDTEGTVFEIATGYDAVQIKHPQLVTITTKPESQTLRSINTGQELLTLQTPLLPSPPSHSHSRSDPNAEEPEQDEEPEPTPTAKRIVTLHSGLLPSTSFDPTSVQSNPLFSQSFGILIDAPSYPPPHFDPASIAPPTPSFRAVDHTSSTFPGVLNSPTLQRALLSPLLSPQRRAASQGSDMSVPPLSLGLSRTSRTSFSTDGQKLSLRPGGGGGSNPSSQPTGLIALIPALAPSSSSQQQPHNSGHSSTNPSSSPSVSAVTQTPPTSTTDPTCLAASLTSSISSSAKKTAEDILSLRRNHDTFVRRAKAELEVLESRIERVRNGTNGGGVVGGGGVVRGFGVPLLVTKEGGRERSKSGSRERGRSAGRAAAAGRTGSIERSPLSHTGSSERKDSPGSRAKDRDEDVSLRLREQDQREEDERGRSRSRQRRRDDTQAVAAGAARSLSRSKKIAEATEVAAMGARERGREAGTSKERENGTDSPVRGGRGGTGPTEDRDIPATTEDDDEEEEASSTIASGLLSPSSAATKHAGGGTTPSFIPSTSTKGLVAIPEAEELSLPPSESSRATSPVNGNGRNRQRSATNESEREEDAPFEMDEDVDVDFLELASSRPIFQQQPPDFSYESNDSVRSPGGGGGGGSNSTFRPGSYQRASALSASFAQLLSTSASAQQAARPPPTIVEQPSSTSPSSTRTPLNGPFSPTTPAASSSAAQRDHPMTSSVQEEVRTRQSALDQSSQTAPDPRDVRRGEQKIRDVLAMDVPSHRRALPRRGEGQSQDTSKDSQGAFDQDQNEQESMEEEEDSSDQVKDLKSPTSKFQVGSLPIPVAQRPSGQAMSSWRPDPEREWAQEREKRGAATGGGVSSSLRPSREGSSWVPPPVDPEVSTVGDSSSTPRASETPTSAAAPLEIGGSSTTGTNSSSSRPAISSSLAQSLRNAPHGSFSARADRERPGINSGHPSEQFHVPSEDDKEDEEAEEDDDGVFLPPHLVADRRARKDEKYLSRSVSRS